MRVLVTGANGFVGSHVVKALQSAKYDVRAFVRQTSNLTNLDGLDIEFFYGDVREPATLQPAFEGCTTVFHVAAIFAYWGYSLNQLNEVAEQGTLNVIRAANAAGVEKMVLTSSSVVLGYNGEPLPFNRELRLNQPDYVLSKVKQLEAARSLGKTLGLKLIIICPTLIVGEADARLSEGNRMIVNYLSDPYKATWIGGSNIVSIKDVAKAHVLAAEKGNPDTCYLVGSDNLEWADVHRILSELTGLLGPLFTANHTVSYLSAMFGELMSLFYGDSPAVSRSQAKMVGQYYWYENNRIRELGLSPLPSRQALAEAVSWLLTSKHISSALRSEIKLSDEIYRIRKYEL